MAFWSNTSKTLEPLRQNRWYMYFGSSEAGENEKKSSLEQYKFALKECSKPSYKIDTTQHILINHTFNYPKNLVWQPIKVKFVSARSDDNCGCQLLTEAVNETMKKSNYVDPSDENQNQISKLSMFQGAFLSNRIQIIQVDEEGVSLEIWDLFNPMVTDVNYGSLSYELENFVDVEMTISYDYAVFDKNIIHTNPTRNYSERQRAAVKAAIRSKEPSSIGRPFPEGDTLP